MTSSIDPTRPTPTIPTPAERTPLLALGAHPDDVEFGCGGVLAAEAQLGRPVHIAVCSRGESASSGTPAQRTGEAAAAAALLGATLHWVDLAVDCELAVIPAHAITLARLIRQLRPGILLAPTPVANQHPDHACLGHLVRDAARLGRYGGIADLRDQPSHAIDQLLFYAVTPEGEPPEASPILYDVSDQRVLATWTAAMQAHASQMATRNYVDLQLTRAHLLGLRAGVTHAIPLYPADPPIITDLSRLGRGARRF